MNVVINADDFGISEEVNRAVVECFRRGLINRTTIMVNMPGAEEAKRLAQENGFFESVGLHINLTQGPALSPECRSSRLCDENGFLKGTFHIPFRSRFFLDAKTTHAIACETQAQIKKYIEMGFPLMHADSHNYTHTYFSIAAPVNRMLKKYGFRSVRISRNIPKKGISPFFRVYKWWYNAILRRLKTEGKRILTTTYFGSVSDFEAFEKEHSLDGSLELMTHPTYKNGILYDNTLPTPRPFPDETWQKAHQITLESDADSRIKMLVLFVKTHTGGAMTALVNFLNALDHKKYAVDVLFYENTQGPSGICQEVNILPQAMIHKKLSARNILSKALYPPYALAAVRGYYYRKVRRNRFRSMQIMSRQGCRYSRRLQKSYDIAIAYELNWCLNYLVRYVDAKVKLAWQHNDYEAIGFDYRVDRKAFRAVDGLVFVSPQCRDKFAKAHRELAKKCFYVPNVLLPAAIRGQAQEPVELPFAKNSSVLTLISVSRIQFATKGLDRGVEVFARLRDDGLLDRVRWLIIGKGKDSGRLQAMIKENGLENSIFWIGLKENPFPYMKACDALFLPSRNEGKPLVVTEAQILGLVPLVARYTSAEGQIIHGVDGLIFENQIDAIYRGIRDIVRNPQQLEGLRENLQNRSFSDAADLKEFEQMVDTLR